MASLAGIRCACAGTAVGTTAALATVVAPVTAIAAAAATVPMRTARDVGSRIVLLQIGPRSQVEAADNTDLSAGVPDRVTAKNVTCVTQRGGRRGRVSTAGLSDGAALLGAWK